MRSIPSAIFSTLLIPCLLSSAGAQTGSEVESEPIQTQIGRSGGPGVVPVDPKRQVEGERTAPKPGKQVVNRVAATVNGRPITTNEVTFRLLPIMVQLETMYPRRGPEFFKQVAKSKREIIDELIDRELVLSHFETKGYMLRDSQIDQEINREIMEHFNGNRDAFLENMKLSKMTIRSYRDITKRRMIVAAMRASKYDPEIPPTPDEINKEYQKTKSLYRDLTKDRIKFKKIFIPGRGEDPAMTPEVQLALSELVAEEAKKKPSSFEDLAKRYSRDQHAEDGGQWPEIERSTLAPEFAAIIFDAPTGKVIGPLLDPMGFTVIVVQSKTLAPPPPLSKIKEQIDSQVRSMRSLERYKQWVDRLRDKAIIKTYI